MLISVIKRVFDDKVRSRRVVAVNREIMFRVIAYNAYRLIIIVIIVWFLQGRILYKPLCKYVTCISI
jgi:hypothetical protein